MDNSRLMHLAYNRESDVLYLSIGEPRPAISREVGYDLLLRIDPNTGEIVGLTVLNLSTRDSETLPIAVDLHQAAD
jgi:uncharacterized protein YuzE